RGGFNFNRGRGFRYRYPRNAGRFPRGNTGGHSVPSESSSTSDHPDGLHLGVMHSEPVLSLESHVIQLKPSHLVTSTPHDRRHVVVDVVLDGIVVKNALLDPGAARTILSRSTLVHIQSEQSNRGLPQSTPCKWLDREILRGVSGSPLNSVEAMICSLKIQSVL